MLSVKKAEDHFANTAAELEQKKEEVEARDSLVSEYLAEIVGLVALANALLAMGMAESRRRGQLSGGINQLVPSDGGPSLANDNRAQTNLVGLLIGLMIAAIVAVQVFIPVVNDSINSSNESGTVITILNLLPLFAALLLLIALASPLMRRV